MSVVAAPNPVTSSPNRSRGRRFGALTVLLFVVALGSLTLGAKGIPPATVVRAFVAYDGSPDHVIVRELRLERLELGLVVGAALGLAGRLMQVVTRNPLADPGLLGVNAGAALGVVVGLYSFGISSLQAQIGFALVGAAAASVVVYGLGSYGRGGTTPVRLALTGAALSATLASFTSALLLRDQSTLDQFRFWVVGSLSGRGSDALASVSPYLLAGAVLAFALARAGNALALGDDAAAALGVSLGRTRLGAGIAITLLCGAATAACGPIAFVGLTVPHVARLLFGPDERWLFPVSALLGALLLVGADIAGRIVARPGEVQVGIMTALIGGPVFVAIVRRRAEGLAPRAVR